MKSQAGWRLVLPWYWVIDLPAFLLRIPFLILRKAGVSPALEETIGGQVAKGILLVGALALLVALGLKKYIPDLLKLR